MKFYELWRYQHIIEPTRGSVLMCRNASYKSLFDILILTTNTLVLCKKFKEISDHHVMVIDKYFGILW